VDIVHLNSFMGISLHTAFVACVQAGKRLLERQRMVNAVLKDEIASIHAFQQNCHTPQEWEAQQGGKSL
jgi:stress-induced morphogen